MLNYKNDLEQRTLNYSKNIIKLCKCLPKNYINLPIINQIIRSAMSVGANYREANDSLGKKDFIMRLKISRKEAKETIYWLNLLIEENENNKAGIDLLLKESIELKKIFSSIIINYDK